MTNDLELTAVRGEGGRTLLQVPDVGFFTGSRRTGELLGGGETAGFLIRLGISRRLRVPAGVVGRVTSARPERVHEPVGYGQTLLELEPIDVSGADAAGDEDPLAGDGETGLVLRASHAGRFWHRPAPDEAAFCGPGDLLEAGDAIGLIEIMKTFTRVAYAAEAGLPARARIVRFLVEDGGDVAADQALVEVEPA